MTIVGNVEDRILAIMNSPAVTVRPVGDVALSDRGILLVADSAVGWLSTAVKAAFAAIVIAAALTAATPAQAAGVGYDADVYGQAQGQVMQQGSARRMTIVDVRAVKIEVPAEQRSGGNQIAEYAITGAAGGVGAILGGQMGSKPATRQVGAIIGGLVGAVAGHSANGMLNGAPVARQVNGVELTLINPQTNQLTTVTQAGGALFAPGDRVLVTQTGASSRVVPDRSPAQDQQQGYGQQQGQQHQYQPQSQQQYRPGTPELLHGQALDQTVGSVMRSAGAMGLQVDVNKVSSLLETGVGERHGTFVGKVTGVDPVRGLVYQDAGRGKGVVFAANSLTRVPSIGETISVKMQNGLGVVEAPRDHGMNRGRG